ncbi:hypothetical protein KEM48_002008 [Puccinia striiformis f. sp. tritici PST-130]|nr:hypothetical protein Pst134EB_016086 [Puccinia striiformis f. sp. tritici]KAI9606297.1 hypothetical protein KEM48_002008 [Puccinia striiformis f. sp. tritici PST-130]
MGTISFQAPLHFVVFSGLGLIDIDLSLRQAPEDTMADSETESSSPTALVLRMLANLVGKYEELARREPGEEKEELTQDDLETKRLLLTQLELSLLPSLQNQLDSYLTSLDIQDDLRNLEPNCELTCEFLSRLEQTLDQTRECVESAALDVIPIGTHDHHLKELKAFRCTTLMSSISSFTYGLQTLFEMSILFVHKWHDWTRDPESTECQQLASFWKDYARRSGTECNKTIRQAYKVLKGSDLDIIQDEWQEKAESLNSTIEVLTSLTTILPRRNRSAFRQHMIKLAHLTMPLIKLIRIFYNDFSSRTRKNLRFTLDTELNSETLTQLHKSATEVTGSFVILGYTLRASYDKNSLAYDHNLIPKRIQVISQTLDSTLVILAMYLIPLPGQTGHSPAANHYKARFVALQERWHCAIKNLSTTLLSFEGHHHQQRAAPEE